MKAQELGSLLQIVIIVFILIVGLYCFCHFGDRVTQRFEDVSDSVYLISWHLLPLNTQSQLPMIISQAQKKVYVSGYADIHSTRQMFTKVNSGHLKLLNHSFKFNFDTNLFWFQIAKQKFFYVMLLRKFWRIKQHRKYLEIVFKLSILLFHHLFWI